MPLQGFHRNGSSAWAGGGATFVSGRLSGRLRLCLHRAAIRFSPGLSIASRPARNPCHSLSFVARSLPSIGEGVSSKGFRITVPHTSHSASIGSETEAASFRIRLYCSCLGRHFMLDQELTASRVWAFNRAFTMRIRISISRSRHWPIFVSGSSVPRCRLSTNSNKCQSSTLVMRTARSRPSPQRRSARWEGIAHSVPIREDRFRRDGDELYITASHDLVLSCLASLSIAEIFLAVAKSASAAAAIMCIRGCRGSISRLASANATASSRPAIR